MRSHLPTAAVVGSRVASLRAGALAWLISIAAASLAAVQQQGYAEQEVLEPGTTNWRSAATSQPVAGTSGPLDEARALLARGEPKKAEKRIRQWLEAHGEDDPRYYEARWLLGEALFMRKHFWQAYEQYERVVENTSGDLFYKALAREVDVARAFLSGEKRIVWKFLRLPAYDDGITILDRVWERAPGTPLGELALKLKADYYFTTGQMDLAQDEYANLAREYPNGRYTQLALLRAAVAAEAAFPGILFDDRPLIEARERYMQFRRLDPAFAKQQQVDERLRAIDEREAEKHLRIAQWYERTERPEAAAYYYRWVIEHYPDALVADQARQALNRLNARAPTSQPAGDVP